jgi:hypothetical protein
MRRKGLPLRWHWQNLNTDKNGRIKGGGWKEGRAWFYFGQRGEGMFDAITVNPSWHIGRWGLAADVHLGHGDSQNESGIHLHIGPVALWCFVGRRGFRPHARERQYGFTWHDQILWIHRGQEFWDGSPWAIHVVDRLLGKAKYSTETLDTDVRAVEIAPGETYRARITLDKSEWRRSRWPWPRRGRYARIEILTPGGVPVPGNLDSDFYHGDDAIFSMSTGAETFVEAERKLRQAAERDREKYGERGWTAKGRAQ